MFTPHLMGEESQIISLFIQDNNEKTRQNLIAFVEKQWDMVESEKKDVSDIIHLLSHNPQIRWIGIEAGEQEIEQLPILVQLLDYQNVKKLFQDDIKLSAEETDHLLHLIFPAYIIAFSKKPEVFQNIQFIPIEDNSLKKSALILMKRTQTIRKQIIDIVKQLSLPFSEFKKIEEIQYGALKISKKIPEAQITTVLDRLNDIELKSLVSEYFLTMNTFIENSFERDRALANNISKQSGEGLIILGIAHRPGVIKHLLSYYCGP